MSPRALQGGFARALVALAALALLAGIGAGLARGERTQERGLIVSLDGGLLHLKLPRDHPAPIGVLLKGGLQTADGSVLPRVTRIQLRLPSQGVLSTRGLPTCPQQRLRDARSGEALAACRSALVGHGHLDAEVLLPNQAPFEIHARLLAFNGRVDGRPAVLLHADAADPPTVAVLPFVVRRGSGRFGTDLVADLPAALGPWPHFAHFEITISRRFRYRGRPRSYLSASCPTPRNLTAGFFSFASTYTLAGGREVAIRIPRTCRAG